MIDIHLGERSRPGLSFPNWLDKLDYNFTTTNFGTFLVLFWQSRFWLTNPKTFYRRRRRTLKLISKRLRMRHFLVKTAQHWPRNALQTFFSCFWSPKQRGCYGVIESSKNHYGRAKKIRNIYQILMKTGTVVPRKSECVIYYLNYAIISFPSEWNQLSFWSSV